MELEDGITVADLAAVLELKDPFSVAVNALFVPKSSYGDKVLKADDKVDIVSPVFGG